ncbi:MAG: SGNH/GDSL hydrolase family protein [Propionibacteriaceae bacterium]|nr:SGNH/GDSL hydrolase family protein [Propionibacteriaceae bacterium]
MGQVSRRQLLAGLALVGAGSVVGCSSGGAARGDNTVYVVDSLTAADSDPVALRFGATSWAAHLDPKLTVVGARTEDGASTEALAEGVTRSDAHTLVVLSGAHDVGRVAFERTAYFIEEIVKTVRSQRVLLCTLPPRDPRPDLHVQFNQNLALLAKDKGWMLCDPSPALSVGVLWAPGMSDDGLHPTVAGATTIGQELSRCLLDPQ